MILDRYLFVLDKCKSQRFKSITIDIPNSRHVKSF